MEIEHLRALVTVVRLGSYSAASKELGVSRVTLRGRVQALEASLMVPLLVSSSQGTTATDTGLWVVERGRRLIADADELRRRARNVHGDLSGELRVVVPIGPPPDLLAGFARMMRTMHPELRVRLTPGRPDSGGPDLDADLIFQLGPARATGAYRTMVLERMDVVLLGARSLLAQRRPQRPEEVVEFPLLGADVPGLDPNHVPLRNGRSIAVQPWFVSPDIHLVRCLVAGGDGLAMLPQAAQSNGVPGEDLEVVLGDRIGSQIEARVLIPEAQVGSPRCRAVIEVMQLLRDFRPGRG